MGQQQRVQGRPSKYTTKTNGQIKDYIRGFLPGEDGAEPSSKGLPSIAGLALHLKVARQTIYNWGAEEGEGDEEFTFLVETVEAMQEQALIEGGLSGRFAVPIAKMMLSKHGWADKIENTLGVTDGAMKAAALMRDMDPAEASRKYAENL